MLSIEKIVQSIPAIKKSNFIIDVSNVCYAGQDIPILNNLILVLNYLIKELNITSENIYSICDPNLQFIIDNKKDFNKFIKNGTVFIAPKTADEFILLLAQKFEFCFIISNDKYRQYHDQLPNKHWLNQRKVSFMLIRDQVCLSPDIEYEALEYLISNEPEEHRTTLDVLEDIENNRSDSEWDLYED
ncbi:MAG: hypothetical protein ACFFG0_14475 [Candidatus Thorarchaeota archaeon]